MMCKLAIIQRSNKIAQLKDYYIKKQQPTTNNKQTVPNNNQQITNQLSTNSTKQQPTNNQPTINKQQSNTNNKQTVPNNNQQITNHYKLRIEGGILTVLHPTTVNKILQNLTLPVIGLQQQLHINGTSNPDNTLECCLTLIF
ncbi:hypothetical protein ACTFIU_000437 [Dictyostelium citrinum]